jgi:glycosyltransferase involved in cell wall biosynthesis
VAGAATASGDHDGDQTVERNPGDAGSGADPVNTPAVAARTGVLFVIYGLAPAGPERRILDFARTFPDSPHALDVHVCVVGGDLTLLDEFQKTKARILHVPMRRPYVEWGSVKKVLDYIEDHDVRGMNSFNLKTLIVCAAAKLRYGSRVKLVHHLISLWEDVPTYQRPITWGAMRSADHILCNGHAVREHLIGSRRMAVPVSVIPNGVDCEYFRPSPQLRAAAREQLGFGDGDFVLGTVGNVRPVKNYPFLLKTMAQLAQRVPNARLLCVGGGPQIEEMKSLAHSLGLAGRVIFTGMAKDIRPFTSAMDAFALCSVKEGNPNVVLQAMAMGLPVVSISVGEVPYIIQDGTSGVLVDGHDERRFVDACARLAGDASLRASIGGAARERVSGLYSSSQMIAGYAALMSATGSRHPVRPNAALLRA